MKLTRALLALAAAFSVGVAQADELDVEGYSGSATFAGAFANPGNASNYVYTDFVWSVGSHFGGVVSPFVAKNYTTQRSFVAFCIEPAVDISDVAAQSVAGTQTYTPSALPAGDAAYAKVQRLFNLYGYAVSLSLDPTTASGSNGVDSKLLPGAMQLAIWNILYDTDSTLASGNVKLVGTTLTGYSAILNKANEMLAGVDNPATLGGDPAHQTVGGIVGTTTIWRAPVGQSQALISSSDVSVPEPSAIALIAAGAAVVGLARRRRPSTQA
jgi:hypothetical protein